MAGRLQAIWRYPVSSMAGEALERAAITPDGIAGDRLWGVVDAATGEIASPKRRRWHPTPHVETRATAAGVQVRLPGGEWQEADAAAAALERHFGFAVAFRRHPGTQGPAGAATVAARYRIRALHLVTTASLATLADMLPQSRPDARRFRPNLVVDWPDRSVPFPETGWAEGSRVTVGAVRLTVVERCRRCAFVTIAQPGLDKDPAILHAVATENGADLGVYCTVAAAGDIAVGDAVGITPA
ncbi:MAG: MOSC domain-containing protein [Alphaproteobacteria bacterium]|nr:MOSC domain-containing protein [Alphaproteobacteria bacterium]